MEPRLIRISAFVLAAVILLGSLSIWAVSTQDTTTADVGDVYDIDVEPNDEVENILSNTTMSDDDEFGDINENKTLFTLIFDEDYPETHVNGTINLYNIHEISQYLHNLNLQLEANGEEVGWLGLSMGYARFEVSRELDETEMQINTTGDGGHTMRQAGEFDLGFLLDINEKQKSVRSQEEITEVAEEYELRVDMNVDGTLVVDGETFDPPYEAEYEEGTEVELEAIPDEDVEFIEWDGIDTDDDNQTTITMDEDYDVTAVFETDVELIVDSTEGGEVVDPGEDTFTYEAGEVIDLEAVADEGHYFVEWTGDVDTIDDTDAAETTIEMLDDYSITANFAPETYDLTVNIDGEGSVEVDGVEIEDGDTLEYESGTVVDLEAIPDEGWSFDEWVGEVEEPQSNDTTIIMDNDYTITATFEEDEDTEFEVEIVDTNDPIREGETLEVTVDVENTGDHGTADIVLFDFENEEADRYEDLTLDTGEEETVLLEWYTEDGDAGRRTITVESTSEIEDSDTEEVIITRLQEDEEEYTYVGDDGGDGVWAIHLEDTIDVDGLDFIDVVLEYYIEGDGHNVHPDAMGGVRIVVDGDIIEERIEIGEDAEDDGEIDIDIDVSEDAEVNIAFEYHTEANDGNTVSVAEIDYAAYEHIPTNENPNEATDTALTQTTSSGAEGTSTMPYELSSNTTYDGLTYEKINNSNQGGIHDVHLH